MYDDHLVSWFSTVMALANKFQIDLSVVKNWGEKKFKIHVKNCLRQNFLEYWQHKKTSGPEISNKPCHWEDDTIKTNIPPVDVSTQW